MSTIYFGTQEGILVDPFSHSTRPYPLPWRIAQMLILLHWNHAIESMLLEFLRPTLVNSEKEAKMGIVNVGSIALYGDFAFRAACTRSRNRFG